jgi:predicted O-linked N-acetylglucosamine transferase (SPINDLY family)
MTVEHFSDISGKQSASQIASLISKDGINILIDLDGYKYGGRVDAMALRPAVIQVIHSFS